VVSNFLRDHVRVIFAQQHAHLAWLELKTGHVSAGQRPRYITPATQGFSVRVKCVSLLAVDEVFVGGSLFKKKKKI
jgi:hypothetical protein